MQGHRDIVINKNGPTVAFTNKHTINTIANEWLTAKRTLGMAKKLKLIWHIKNAIEQHTSMIKSVYLNKKGD